MSNRSCEDCKWDMGGECKQGHVRWNRDKKWIIESCHAWKEKVKCWCEYPWEKRNNYNISIQDIEGLPNPVWKIIFCPACGKDMR